MTNEKFDKSYVSKDEHEEMVKMIVDELMAEELMDNPFDFFFRSSSDYFPNACHEVLELPGIFEKKLNSSIFSFTGRSLQADVRRDRTSNLLYSLMGYVSAVL